MIQYLIYIMLIIIFFKSKYRKQEQQTIIKPIKEKDIKKDDINLQLI